MTRLEEAIALATLVHKGQVDKAGVDYILHPLNVSRRCKSESAKIVAVLHDTIEDGKDKEFILKEVSKILTLAELRALLLLTKRAGITYTVYIEDIMTCEIAKEVKLADLEENLRLDRGYIPHSLRKRYEKAYVKIKQETLK